MRKTFIAVAAVVGLTAGGAQAALLDLASRNLVLGDLLFSTNDAEIFFVGPDVDPGGDFFQIADVGLNFTIDGEPSNPTSAALFELSTGFNGEVIDFEIDLSTGMGEGLFGDGFGEFALAKVSFPAGLSQLPGGSDDFVEGGLGVEIFDVTTIPLPAALPLALAGFGALALVGRTRRSA